jgi:ribosomal protein L11 methyltransferase
MPGVTYPFVEITTPVERADIVSALLLHLGASGLEERDGGTMVPAPRDRVVVVGWFESRERAEAAASALRARIGGPDVEISTGDVEDPGWREAWRDYFHPMRFGERLWVAPPDEDPVGTAPGAVVVRLIPSGAFGSGTHESTAMVLELLHDLVAPGATVLDVGCGSGILAMAAGLLGAREAWGIDIDPEALVYARENAAANALGARCRFDGTPVRDVPGRFDLVLANLSAPVLQREKADLAAKVAPHGRLVWSGLLRDDVTDLGRPPGMTSVDQRTRNDWVAQVWAHAT